jgi:hypothetical protein
MDGKMDGSIQILSLFDEHAMNLHDEFIDCISGLDGSIQKFVQPDFTVSR